MKGLPGQTIATKLLVNPEMVVFKMRESRPKMPEKIRFTDCPLSHNHGLVDTMENYLKVGLV